MSQILFALFVVSLCCFARAWSLKQWPFNRRTRYRVTVYFEARLDNDQHDPNWIVKTEYSPLIWETTIPFLEIRRHLPQPGEFFDDKEVSHTNIDTI